jgi:hypothetical protein
MDRKAKQIFALRDRSYRENYGLLAAHHYGARQLPDPDADFEWMVTMATLVNEYTDKIIAGARAVWFLLTGAFWFGNTLYFCATLPKAVWKLVER